MGRKRENHKREVNPDPVYDDLMVTKTINALMSQGRKSVAERIFYGSMDLIQERTGQDGIEVFRKAVENTKPSLEVKSRRIGGATYQVPIEVKPDRRQALATRWLIIAARGRHENSMVERFANELLEASTGRGNAMKKKEDTHRMADANQAFAHFRW